VLGVAVAIAALAGAATRGVSERLDGDRRVASALSSASTVPAPAGALADVAAGRPGGSLDLGSTGAAGPVAVAEQLLRLGVREEPAGSDGGPMVLAVTDGNREPWCADFVSYAFMRAGLPFTGGFSGGWRIPGALALRGWFVDRGRWSIRTGARPQPGDVVYFTWDHVGIVRRVVGGTLETIEGNASHAVRLRVYHDWRGNPEIDGFGRR
jgi:hypothetical protein